MQEVLVNRLGGLSLPRKSVVRLTDRPDMTLDVYCGRKTTIQHNREKSGNLKINGFGRQSSENLFILFKREKDVLSRGIVWAHLPSHRGLLIKKRICSHGEPILSFKSNPQI